MSTEAFYGYVALGIVVQLAAATLVKRLHSPADRPASGIGMFGLAFSELAGASLFWWLSRKVPMNYSPMVLAGFIGVYIVDLAYLTQLKKQPMPHAAKRAAILMLTAATLVTVIGAVGWMLIMLAAFSHGR